uniref:Uncharacterized protein n=1 Tax=Siphoviridae sp. ctxrg1 TaxID=2825741 RepID=A0A8S5Q628_9CAUD|nr:MAG TPA: hypothetical protein [Siphoviridae sp. ctxrg1]
MCHLFFQNPITLFFTKNYSDIGNTGIISVYIKVLKFKSGTGTFYHKPLVHLR